MRSSWDTDLDEPASITERDLRSLRRGARAGRLAMLLALLSVAVGAWSLIIGPDSLAGFEEIQDLKLKVLSAIGRPAPPETHPAQASAPDSSLSPESSRAAGSAQAASIPAGPAKSTARDSSGVRLSSSNRR